MFGIDSSELLVIALVALVVIGPKDLPRVMRVVGQWVGRARGMASHLRAGIDEVIRQAELEEMEKRWAAENARIMAEHPYLPEQEPVLSPAIEHEPAPSDPVPVDQTTVMTPLPLPGMAREEQLDLLSETKPAVTKQG